MYTCRQHPDPIRRAIQTSRGLLNGGLPEGRSNRRQRTSVRPNRALLYLRPVFVAGFALGVPAGAFGQRLPELRINYDRFTESTKARIYTSVDHRRRPQITLFRSSKGRTVVFDTEPTLMLLMTSSDDWQYLECNDVALLADDKPVKIIAGRHRGSVGAGYVLEQKSVRLTTQSIKQLARATTIALKYCNVEFTLDEPETSTFKMFYTGLAKGKV